jgi:hydrogenase small subunit
LVLDLISLDYHETLMAAAGKQAEAALQAAMRKNAGKYICIVEGAIPMAHNGAYMQIAGRTGVDMVREVAKDAALVIAIGSCASWGGLPSADPNPTGAVGVQEVLKGQTVVKLPGCPANPYVLLGVALQYAAMGKLPELDATGRPKFAYGRTIHEQCPRRAHFDGARFAVEFGDEGHRQGYCLYKLGCKGPDTHASCPTNHFCEVVDAWPIGLGAPCFGCTEQSLAFRVPMFQTIPIDRPGPPDTYPGITAQHGSVGAVATGLAGLAAGAVLGVSAKVARMLKENELKKESGGKQ